MKNIRVSLLEELREFRSRLDHLRKEEVPPVEAHENLYKIKKI